jgi:hypothetical protein
MKKVCNIVIVSIFTTLLGFATTSKAFNGTLVAQKTQKKGGDSRVGAFDTHVAYKRLEVPLNQAPVYKSARGALARDFKKLDSLIKSLKRGYSAKNVGELKGLARSIRMETQKIDKIVKNAGNKTGMNITASIFQELNSLDASLQKITRVQKITSANMQKLSNAGVAFSKQEMLFGKIEPLLLR